MNLSLLKVVKTQTHSFDEQSLKSVLLFFKAGNFPHDFTAFTLLNFSNNCCGVCTESCIWLTSTCLLIVFKVQHHWYSHLVQLKNYFHRIALLTHQIYLSCHLEVFNHISYFVYITTMISLCYDRFYVPTCQVDLITVCLFVVLRHVQQPGSYCDG